MAHRLDQVERRLELAEARLTKVERSARRNHMRFKEAIEALELARVDYRAETQRLRDIVAVLENVRVTRSAPPR
jgi:ribosomal protein L1